MRISTRLLSDITIARFQRMLEVIDFDPPYQREGSVWRRESQTLLIDSIINGLDLPKLYFEELSSRRLSPQGLSFQYAVIDGKQRLEAIRAFLSGDLALAHDFILFEDPEVAAGGMSLAELSEAHPRLAQRFLQYELPVVRVVSDSGDLIEEMFQRLNASMALNAAERRNAIAGPTREAVNTIARHPLLMEKSPIKSARYKYRELAAKFLVVEHQVDTRGRVIDTKAATLLNLFTASKGDSPEIPAEDIERYQLAVNETLDRMVQVFEQDDRLLASIGTVVVYYLVFRDIELAQNVTRNQLAEFEALRREAGSMSEDDADYALSVNARLREYNVLVQSTNDGRALSTRATVLAAFLRGYTAEKPDAGLTSVTDLDVTLDDATE